MNSLKYIILVIYIFVFLEMANDITGNVEEDAELRELLISNLESRGVLSKIKVYALELIKNTKMLLKGRFAGGNIPMSRFKIKS